jgi:hypothetical protein
MFMFEKIFDILACEVMMKGYFPSGGLYVAVVMDNGQKWSMNHEFMWIGRGTGLKTRFYGL